MIEYGKHTYGALIRRGEMNTVRTGKYCQIGENCIVDSGFSHNSKNISTYPFHAWEEPNRWDNNNICRGDVIIGSDCWLGESCLIMSGVTIGDGSCIGARSIITKDVQPYSIIVSTDRLVRKRFSDKDIATLLRIKWWDLPDEVVTKIVPFLHGNDVDRLLEEIENLNWKL